MRTQHSVHTKLPRDMGEPRNPRRGDHVLLQRRPGDHPENALVRDAITNGDYSSAAGYFGTVVVWLDKYGLPQTILVPHRSRKDLGAFWIWPEEFE